MIAQGNDNSQTLFHVLNEMLPHFVNNDTKHIDSNGSFISIVSLEILGFVSYWDKNSSKKFEQMRDNIGKILDKVISHDQTKSLPSW